MNPLAIQTKSHVFSFKSVLFPSLMKTLFILTRAIGIVLFLNYLLRRLRKINTDPSYDSSNMIMQKTSKRKVHSLKILKCALFSSLEITSVSTKEKLTTCVCITLAV